MKLLNLEQKASDRFELSWDDKHIGFVSAKQLRDRCPCAGCKGETVLLRTYVPPKADVNTPGRYEVRGVEMVGGYAVKFVWGDGHDQGLYTWEHLRSLCECDECLATGRQGEG